MAQGSQTRTRSFSKIAVVCAIGVTLLCVRAAALHLKCVRSSLSSILTLHPTHARRACLDIDNGFDLSVTLVKAHLLPPLVSARGLTRQVALSGSHPPTFRYQNRPPPIS